MGGEEEDDEAVTVAWCGACDAARSATGGGDSGAAGRDRIFGVADELQEHGDMLQAVIRQQQNILEEFGRLRHQTTYEHQGSIGLSDGMQRVHDAACA